MVRQASAAYTVQRAADFWLWPLNPLWRLAKVRERGVSIPNIITLARILLVPVIVWRSPRADEIAFGIFVIAGVSDAVDGFSPSAHMASELGALPIPGGLGAAGVDLVALGIGGACRADRLSGGVARHMIVGAVIISWLFGKPIR